ncbi:hypothetical protein B0H13DRAFT_2294581 [Mycena leptocephala]|nr:hypothetical protein B0H13DRAFT_2294581 [Mycena leptocephala]
MSVSTKKRTFSPTANRHPRMRIPTKQGKRVWNAYALPNADDRAQNTGITGRVTAQGGVQLTRTSGGQLTRAAGSGRVVGNGRELGEMEEWRAVQESGGPSGFDAILPAIRGTTAVRRMWRRSRRPGAEESQKRTRAG